MFIIKGIIVKKDSKYCYVYNSEKKITMKSYIKGSIKKTFTIQIGDIVELELIDDINNVWNIINIKERKNQLHRPNIVNVDQVIIVTSLLEPLFATYLLNKYILFLELNNIKPILFFTKYDLLKKHEHVKDVILEKIDWYKKYDYKIFIIDNKNFHNDLRAKIIEALNNNINVITGQTGAGKSSTINNFLPEYNQIKTNEISKALNRGKHTTTNTEIHIINNDILIADTPGFSSFDLKNIDINQINSKFSFFKNQKNKCFFSNCLHISEIKCEIKKELNENKIPLFLYNDYVKIITEIKGNNKYGK